MARKRLLAGSAASILAVALVVAAGRVSAAPVPQPIAFPHKVHVTGYKMECRFCHSSANKSQYVNIPSVQKCMTCHRSIATGNAEVKKLAGYWKEKKPIPWNQVVDFPNHAYFPHWKMVNAGIACLTCHPGMDQAGTAEQTLDLGMGFCMKCHRSRKVSIDCWTCHY